MPGQKPLIIAVTGPTASGKTDLAMRLSKYFPIELINMDSAQIYRQMNIGTAKITSAEQAEYPHHLMDILSPEESYSAAQFVADVRRLVPQINARGNIPLVVGGTILYYKALTEGLANLPSANQPLRDALRAEIKQHGHGKLLAELNAIDPQLAAQIQGKDTQRLVRFVEIARLTGKPPSELFAAQGKQANPYRFFHIAFFPEDRGWLHQRIEKRFAAMLAQGLVDEVNDLREKYRLHPTLPSMRCAGYRQVWDYLEGKFADLPANKNNKPGNTPYQEMRDRGIFATRQLAKRQLTWLRKIPADVTISNPEHYSFEEIVTKIQLVILS
ncbi:MAG: tRNA (adenosine(37)-N6)-dimethylallyltransferase MiaA [Gammaproteobacteria bacterium]|nr:MAG: tRNA (adenosine(37)-N6)-dimethylallyltransferase MiaA [Gammaproteobacteria bacterium]